MNYEDIYLQNRPFVLARSGLEVDMKFMKLYFKPCSRVARKSKYKGLGSQNAIPALRICGKHGAGGSNPNRYTAV
jgi:hypothetical protein